MLRVVDRVRYLERRRFQISVKILRVGCRLVLESLSVSIDVSADPPAERGDGVR